MSAELPHLQPNFYRDGDEVMFHFAVSEGHIVGPRPVTEVDKINHADAWAAFEAREAAPVKVTPPPKTTPYTAKDIVGGKPKAAAKRKPRPSRKKA